MRPRTAGWILIVISAVTFGAMGVLVKRAYRGGVDQYSVLALRFVIATAALAPLAAMRRRPLPPLKTIAGLLLFGSGGYVAHSLCYFIALNHATAGLVGLLLYFYPVLVALGGAAFFGERLGWGRMAALAVAVAGTGLAVSPGGDNRPLGIVLALACATLYGSYILACSRVTRGVDPLISATVIIAGAAAVYGAVALWRRSPLPPTPEGWMLVAAIGLVSTAAAIATFFAAMERIGPTSAAAGATLEPMVTVLLSAIVLDERLSPLQLGGGALILGAVAWLATRPPVSSP